MNMKKDEMIAYMWKHNIEIPNPTSTKPVLLEKIREKGSMSLILWLKKKLPIPEAALQRCS